MAKCTTYLTPRTAEFETHPATRMVELTTQPDHAARHGAALMRPGSLGVTDRVLCLDKDSLPRHEFSVVTERPLSQQRHRVLKKEKKKKKKYIYIYIYIYIILFFLCVFGMLRSDDASLN